MEFRVLGPVEIRRGGSGEVVAGRLRRILLGLLLVRANQSVSVDVLTEALWGEGERVDERAGQRLHLHVHRLRLALGEADRISFGPDGYQIRIGEGELDAERFDALVGEGTQWVTRDPARAVIVLREALALWRGTPFLDVDVPLLADWSQRLGERRLAAYETLYQAELACGRSTSTVGELAGLVREFPLRERLHGLLMVALYRSGRREEALGAYRVARG
ncbi:AfsR/SARP family transcriptional regulator, partial [Streptomyces sp. 4N509B]|uniref:AfsR/SARP family transcriptional regulator n=1 Tax=Streptomyces sp. 4N509B TaxID=3457413 RepID=UPI003FD20266